MTAEWPPSPIMHIPCRIEFDVTLCPIAGPQSACATKRIGGTGRRLLAVPDTALFNAVPGTT